MTYTGLKTDGFKERLYDLIGFETSVEKTQRQQGYSVPRWLRYVQDGGKETWKREFPQGEFFGDS
ncbi:MAG: hypothetical protein QM401_01035 [Bacillota bacterium]|nr:hypothetical protein [Bacillota bacterium]